MDLQHREGSEERQKHISNRQIATALQRDRQTNRQKIGMRAFGFVLCSSPFCRAIFVPSIGAASACHPRIIVFAFWVNARRINKEQLDKQKPGDRGEVTGQKMCPCSCAVPAVTN
mmetsp:Transcript_50190/g.98820  ORF Transcript_50190/g.98820 Transcript_50190/m.98820 type:complete len:115 (-) Transcript_50190:231-575(-)